MRKLIVLLSVVVLGAVTVSCGSASESANSASSVLPSMSVFTPSPLEARAPGNGGGNGKGGNANNQSGASSSSLELAMVNDLNGDELPNWGDTVTFNVSTSATSDPTVELLCSQNGEYVYGAQWPWTPNLMLSSSAWRSGAADCTATLFPLGDRKRVLATLTFTAGA